MVSRTPNQSVTIAKRDVAEILRDLCFWQSLATSMSLAELTQKITPYFSVYFFCTESFYDGNDFEWDRMKHSVDSKLETRSSKTGALIIEGHHALSYSDYEHLSTTMAVLPPTAPLMQERSTPPQSIRKHKLHISKMLGKIEALKSYGVFGAGSSEVCLDARCSSF
jgi:hypothetical protein